MPEIDSAAQVVKRQLPLSVQPLLAAAAAAAAASADVGNTHLLTVSLIENTQTPKKKHTSLKLNI